MELPGYYYDPEKKKYFKVEKNHLAPKGSKYTKDQVSKQKESAAKRRKLETHEERVSQEKIGRSPAFSNPILGALGLQRELGQQPRSKVSISRGEASVNLLECRRLIDVTSIRQSLEVVAFERDPRSARLYASLNCPGALGLRVFPLESRQYPFTYDRPMQRSQMTDLRDELLDEIAISRFGHMLLLSHSYRNLTAHFAISHLLKPGDPGFDRGQNFQSLCHIRFSYAGYANCNIATSPFHTTSKFTVGCCEKLTVVTNHDYKWDIRSVQEMPAPISAVEWMNGNIIVAGCFYSQVCLHDLRRQESIPRFHHVHGVRSIKRLDDNKIIVAGMDRSLSMYDLRFTARPKGAFYRPNVMAMGHSPAKPYMEFGDIPSTQFHNIDVCQELGLLACGTDLKTIQLYSLATGKRFGQKNTDTTSLNSYGSSGDGTSITDFRYDAPVTRVKFQNLPDRFELLADCEDEQRDFTRGGNAGIPSLLVSSGSVVDEWHP